MQINVTDNFSLSANALLFPLAEGAEFPPFLLDLANQAGVSETVISADFRGSKKELYWFYLHGKRIFLLGLGKSPKFATYLQAARSAVHQQRKKLPAQIAIHLGHLPQTDLARLAEATINGILLGRYEMGRFKSDKDQPYPFFTEDASLVIQVGEKHLKAINRSVERARVFAEAQLQIFDLVNAPSNKKTPQDMVNWALDSKRSKQLKVRVFSMEEIRELGFHGLIAVNRGSEHPAAFILFEYLPENSSSKTPKVGLVGKGVTFDTGGLSLKPSTNMHFMKSDMGGAAAVFGTMEVVSKLGLPIHLVAAVPVTDNSVDAKAIKPSDVIDSYSGKTIEVIDTDAEGRLILADGLSYIKRNYQPEILIDLATLTGSVIRAIGYFAGGLFSNNDQLAERLLNAGDETGERLWRFPIWDEYKDYIKSDVADVKNFSGKPMAGAITAAKFLEHFIDDHPQWAHLDIAGVAIADSEFSRQKSATAFGIRLLVEFLENLE